jgi:uncharacterized protein YbjT (DUF2867 family)
MAADVVLVTGATGAIGSRLVPALVASGRRVRCLSRDPAALGAAPWAGSVEAVAGDVLDRRRLRRALEGVSAAYYLVHGMATGVRDLERLEERMAVTFRQVSDDAGVRRLIYLGGLIDEDRVLDLSPHMHSRWRAGQLLAGAAAPLTEVRAGIVIGRLSASYRILRAVAEGMPVLPTSAWSETRCQPIALADVVTYLVAVLDAPRTTGEVLEAGGPDVLTYTEMVAVLREELGMPRVPRVRVPSLGPELAAPVVRALSGVSAGLGLSLLASARLDAVVGSHPIGAYIEHDPLPYREALRQVIAEEAVAAGPHRGGRSRW